jgi:hypothetical protein
MDTSAIICVFAGRSRNTLRQAELLAQKEIDLNKTVEDIVISYPDGVEQRTTEYYRLGDYFDRIQILDHPDDSQFFELVFHPRLDAGKYWKDLVEITIVSIGKSAPGVWIASVTAAHR